MHRSTVAVLALVLALSACGKSDQKQTAQTAPAPVVTPVPDPGPVPQGPLPRDATPTHYRLAFTIDPTKDGFSGHAEIDVKFARKTRTLYIHGLDIKMKSALLRLGKGQTVAVRYKEVDKSGVVLLTFAHDVPAGAATLVFDYDAPYNQSLVGLYKVVARGDAYAFTQFEATDARRAFPGFDEPGFKTPFDVTVTAPAADKVIANTPVANDTGAAGGMMRWTFQTTKPLPTYLVALAIGPLDIIDMGDIPPNQYRDHPLHLRGIAARGMGPKLQYALSLTPSIINALEAYYGIGYPFQKVDILAVPDFAAGAMENAGAVTFREQLLLMDASAPLDQKLASLDVQSHELAHQWFGDFVTPTWWDDIWLNESFATWMESKTSNTVRPDQEFARESLRNGLGVMRLDELPSARQIHNPVKNGDDIDNAFDDITYAKGDAVLAMFESYVGPADWQKGIHAYLTKFAFGNATAQDFITTIATTTGHPEIVDAFNDFIDQPGIPLLTAALSCGASANANVTQAPYTPVGIPAANRQWKVPMCLTADLNRACQLVTPPSTQVLLGQTCPKTLFPNAEGAGYYRFAMDEKSWGALIAAAPTLDPADQSTLFHNIDAALRGGTGSAGDFFAVIHALAPTAQWDLLAVDPRSSFNAIDSLHDLRVTGVLTAADLPAYQAFIRRNFGPRLAPLGLASKPGEPVADALMREALAQLLVEEGRDPALIVALTKAAHAYLASSGKDLGGIAPELLQEAMRAGVMSEGAPFCDQLLAALQKSDDEFFIQSVIYAVAGAGDEISLDKLLALSLTPAIRTGDLRYVTRYMQAEEKGRPVLWAWFKMNFDALEKRVSSQGLSRAPEIQEFGCDVQTKADLDAFFGPRTSQLEGTPRTLKENGDRIDRCIAFKAAKSTEIGAALKAAK